MIDTAIVVELVSALLFTLIGFVFIRVGRRISDSLLVLFGIGFIIIGLTYIDLNSYLFDASDVLRLIAQVCGASILLLSYVVPKNHEYRFLEVIGYGIVVAISFTAFLYWIIPPAGVFPPENIVRIFVHVSSGLLLIGCAAFAFITYFNHRKVSFLPVPIAFLSLAIGKYTLLIFDMIGYQGDFSVIVYLWRFTAISLLLLTIILSMRLKGE